MKLKIGLLGLLCLFFRAGAQQKGAVYPLKVGDRLPVTVFQGVLNYPSDRIALSDFNDKLVILDFWSTSCGSCIAMLPGQVKLQRQFKDKVQIVLVDCKNTRDTRQRVVNFFRAFHPEYRALPSIVEDTLLAGYFPHRSVGYYVWLYNGKVMTMADEAHITADNIRQFIAGRHAVFALDKDIPYDLGRPIFLNGNGGRPPRFMCRTTWASYKPGLHSSSAYRFNGNRLCSGFVTVNSSRYSFCLLAFPQLRAVPYNRLVFKGGDPVRFQRGSNCEQWRLHNLYTYEVAFPPVPVPAALKRVEADVIKFFHLRVDSGYRTARCFVIKSAGGVKEGRGPGNKGAVDPNAFIRDLPLSVPLGYLNDRSPVPFVDESGFTGTISMTYSLDDLSTDQLIAKLEDNGLIVEPAIRKLKFYTISETAEAGQ